MFLHGPHEQPFESRLTKTSGLKAKLEPTLAKCFPFESGPWSGWTQRPERVKRGQKNLADAAPSHSGPDGRPPRHSQQGPGREAAGVAPACARCPKTSSANCPTSKRRTRLTNHPAPKNDFRKCGETQLHQKMLDFGFASSQQKGGPQFCPSR